MVVSGVPPDFSARRQRWGNPLYRWDVMKAQGYEWWIQRLALGDAKFRTTFGSIISAALISFWEIPASDPTANQRPMGRWSTGRFISQAARSARRDCHFSPKMGYHHARVPRSARAAADSGDGGVASLVSATRARHVFATPRRRQSDLHGNARQRYDRFGWFKSGAAITGDAGHAGMVSLPL